MWKQLLSVLLASVSILLSSCGLVFNEDAHEADQTKAIISALEDEDSEALRSLFSKKALDEIDDWDSQADALFRFFDGNIISWEAKDGRAGSESDENGKKAVMLRYGFHIRTDADEYDFFLIDYATDTIDPDNEGLYMLELHKTSYDGDWAGWQERMKAGVSIVE